MKIYYYEFITKIKIKQIPPTVYLCCQLHLRTNVKETHEFKQICLFREITKEFPVAHFKLLSCS